MGENIVPGVEGRRRGSGKEGGGRRQQHSLHFLIYEEDPWVLSEGRGIGIGDGMQKWGS